MAGLAHGKIMHLVNQADYDLLQSLKQKKSDEKEIATQGTDYESDEIKMKHLNEQMMRNDKEKKFKENEQWDKVGTRLGKIIQPDSTVEEKSRMELVDDIVDVLSGTFKTKGRQLVNRLMKQEGIKIDRNFIYINEKPLEHNVSDVVDQLVRPRKKLLLNIDRLIQYLSTVNFPKSLIANLEAISRISSVSFSDQEFDLSSIEKQKESTPKPRKTRKRGRLNKTAESTGEPSEYFDPDQVSLFLSSQEGNGSNNWINF